MSSARPRGGGDADGVGRGRRGNAGGDALGGFDRDGEVGAVTVRFSLTIGVSPSRAACSSVIGMQIRPRPYVARKLIFSG